MATLKIKDENGNWVSIQTLKGDAGEPGKDGQDGYTPVKGVDYFDGVDGKDGKDGEDYILTDADKQDIASLVLDGLPVAEEEAF